MAEPGLSRASASLSRVVLREQLTEIVRERILDGTYLPGTRIVELQLAREFGTSQGPVREALRDLEAERLVETEAFRGARVVKVSHDELIEAYPVRVALEEAAIRGATVNLRGDVGPLELALEAMLEAARANDYQTMMQHHITFHRILVEASQNRILIGLWKSLRTELQITMSTVGSESDQLELCERHRPLIDAVASQDVERAGLEIRRHIEHIADLLRDVGTEEGAG